MENGDTVLGSSLEPLDIAKPATVPCTFLLHDFLLKLFSPVIKIILTLVMRK